MRSKFAVSDINVFKQKVLSWLKQFNTFCFLDSHNYASYYELLVGAGVKRIYESSANKALQKFQIFLEEKKSWLFGHMAYELPTGEKVSFSQNEDQLHFQNIFFFEPEVILFLKHDCIVIEANKPQQIYNDILAAEILNEKAETSIEVKNKISRNEYIEIIHKLQQHIHRGDCYEINFCQEFFAENATIDPFKLFNKLNALSPNPFSAIYRIDDKWVLCASPERFIKKVGARIISQPIKGTLTRHANILGLREEQLQLSDSSKDRSENVMIVDLVRNDLSRICEEGSVNVEELFGVYSFPQVHQMISTISGILRSDIKFMDIINATFPMGSMTGAPKIKVMQLIDFYEKSRRGIFSGCLGYINPDGDFDFNVVIRSLMYNQSTKYLSFQSGGGITAYSNAEKEWEECMIKAKAIKEVLSA